MRFWIAALSLLLPCLAFGQSKRPSPEFLFAEDGKAQDADLYMKTLKSKPGLSNEPWLSAPLTRLDYVLMHIQSRLDASASDYEKEYLPTYFERRASRMMRPSIELGVRYREEIGALFLGADVNNVGKPKKPISEFCKFLGDLTLDSFPPEIVGFSGSGNLGLLIRDDPRSPKYQEVFQKLVDSIVTEVHVTSVNEFPDKDDIFIFTCRKQSKNQEYEFFKSSVSSPHLPRD